MLSKFIFFLSVLILIKWISAFVVMQHKDFQVLFQAKSWAQNRDTGAKTLVFDIILEESYYGVPLSALPIVITAVGAVVVSFTSFSVGDRCCALTQIIIFTSCSFV